MVWDVTINQAMDTIKGATVTETFPNGLIYESVTVYKPDVDFNGNVTGTRTLVDPNEYSVVPIGNVTFANDISQAYILEYVTKIDSSIKPPSSASGSIPFANTAVLGGKNIADSSATASVTAAFTPAIVKQVADTTQTPKNSHGKLP